MTLGLIFLNPVTYRQPPNILFINMTTIDYKLRLSAFKAMIIFGELVDVTSNKRITANNKLFRLNMHAYTSIN